MQYPNLLFCPTATILRSSLYRHPQFLLSLYSKPVNTVTIAGRVVLAFAWSRWDDDGCGSDRQDIPPELAVLCSWFHQEPDLYWSLWLLRNCCYCVSFCCLLHFAVHLVNGIQISGTWRCVDWFKTGLLAPWRWRQQSAPKSRYLPIYTVLYNRRRESNHLSHWNIVCCIANI